MNFMDAELTMTAGKLTSRGPEPVTFTGSDALSEYVGKTVVFGIRPENLHTSGEKFTRIAAATSLAYVGHRQPMGRGDLRALHL